MDLNGVNKFFVRQKFTLIGNEYFVSTLGADNKDGEPIAYVRQKRMKIREQVNFFTDDSQQEQLMRIQKRGVFEFRGRSDVFLPSGESIGQLQKVFGKSFLRSTWELLDPQGNVIAGAQERSMAMAILRRVWGLVPYIGEIPFFIPFHFDFTINGQVVGGYNRPPGLTDRYVMDLSGDPDQRIDRRMAIAFAIALDALQDR